MHYGHFKESFFLWLANSLPRSHATDNKLRSLLLAKADINIDRSAIVWDGIEIRLIGAAPKIQIGHSCFINSKVRFECVASVMIAIGNHVLIGLQCSFETINHSLLPLENNKRGMLPQSIVIEDFVWIAARVTILPGVKIGTGSVIAAGAADVAPYTLVGGVPAREIKKLAPTS